jgi:hypothetical protein
MQEACNLVLATLHTVCAISYCNQEACNLVLAMLHKVCAFSHRVQEAYNLVLAMLHKKPSHRPAMQEVQRHPLWWSTEQRLQFLLDISDRCVSAGVCMNEGVCVCGWVVAFRCGLV